MNRRQFLLSGLGALGAAATLRWAGRARAGERTSAVPRPAPKAHACIVLWMNGGPSHLDTWDPKPGTAVAGPLKAIATRQAGVEISEQFPHIADVADRLCIVRGLSTREGNHDRAQLLLHTGWTPTPTVSFPSLGSWVSSELADANAPLPGFISVAGPSRGPGFLGVEYAPFVVPKAGEMPRNIDYARDVDMTRFLRRKSLLDKMEVDFAARTGDARVRGRQEVLARAVRFMHGSRLDAFDLRAEPDAARTAYGESDFGRGCLLARRLVEAGVRYVEVTLDGWDTHLDNFTRTRALAGALDPALAALVRDLDERKLLDSTLVVCIGEFGRSPKINEREGRDHHPRAFSALLAGGGLKRGVTYGKTSATGEEVVAEAVSVPDLFATLATQLGLDPDKEVITPRGRPITLTNKGQPLKALIA